MFPSRQEIRQQLSLLESDMLESEHDEIFLMGVKRALEWTQGIGVSPLEFLKMIARVQTRH